MDNKQQLYQLNNAAPNLINVCVDKNGNGEFEGRIYDCYHKEPGRFENLIQLLHGMEALYDNLGYPQASTRSRYFYTPREVELKDMEMIQDPETIFEERGEKGSFGIWVRTRQNATWQGEVTWLEEEAHFFFSSVLDLVKIIDNMLGEADWE